MIQHLVLAPISTSVSHWSQSCPQPSALISLWRNACGSFRTIPFRLCSQSACPDRLACCGTDHMARLNSTLCSEFHFPPCPAYSVCIEHVFCRFFLWNTCSNKCSLASGYRRVSLPFTYSLDWASLLNPGNTSRNIFSGYPLLGSIMNVGLCSNLVTLLFIPQWVLTKYTDWEFSAVSSLLYSEMFHVIPCHFLHVQVI